MKLFSTSSLLIPIILKIITIPVIPKIEFLLFNEIDPWLVTRCNEVLKEEKSRRKKLEKMRRKRNKKVNSVVRSKNSIYKNIAYIILSYIHLIQNC